MDRNISISITPIYYNDYRRLCSQLAWRHDYKMYDAFNIDSPAPDGQHRALLAFSGEVRFGPSYYVLSIDGHSFGERIFGGTHLWSPSSTLLAVQEWLTLDYSEGPITALVVIDLSRGREASIARVTKAFIVPTAFEDLSIVYRTDYGGQAGTGRSKVDTTKIGGW